MKNILTITMNPTIDVSSSVPNVFPEHKLRCGPVRHEPGGGGINVSRAIKKLGGDSIAFHFCGGPTGDILRTLLDEEGIVQETIPINDWTRQCVTISEAATTQQYRFVFPGPTVSEEEWRDGLERVLQISPKPDFAVASGSLPPGIPDDFYGRLARNFRAAGIRLILDTSGHALLPAIEAGLFLIKPSLREFQIFTGRDLDHESEQEEAAMEFVTSGSCEVVVVSLGASGVIFASRAGCERMRSPKVPVRSKVGAGDSMVAGITLALSRGLSLRDAVIFGVASGAAAVMSPGTELCRRQDAERLYDQLSSPGEGSSNPLERSS
jgi:6-phosphofructokinase 2